MNNTQSSLGEPAKYIGVKIERVKTLTEILERGIEQEYDADMKQLESLAYIISDNINEIKEKFEILESKIIETTA